MAEPILRCFLQIGINRQLHAPPFFRGLACVRELLDLTAQAVDLDELVPVTPHQDLIERLFDAGLADDGAGFEPLILRT